ncbi:MAG: hypothetical protein H8D94_01380 [Candidatus Pelagibacter sp.]|nr:hypothetical protein [Candidatus Pelagibacter sp.]
MGDILKEAIADAKAVRATALANAKMALEEAFTPQLKSMLSAKLKEDEFGDEEEESEDEIGDDEESAEPFEEDEEFGGDDADEEESFEDDEEVAETIEVNGKTYSLVSEDDEEEGEEAEDAGDDEEVEFEEELDLEAIIRELEDELSEDESVDEDTVEEAEGEEAEDEEYEIDETLFSEEDGDDEEDEEEVEESTDVSDIQSELDEYKEAVVFLKDKLHEVNILNAKLLFTNKLFKEFALDNNQKLKVVETFDRTQSTREIKLVYSTLAEQFSDNGSINKRNPIKESASAKSGSTKPSKESRKVITEEVEVANRFKKLAGLL